MDPVTLITQALQGTRVDWRTPTHPRFDVPAHLARPLQAYSGLLKEILMRAAVLRTQAAMPSPVPLLILPGVHADPGECLTCGVALPFGFRCPLCLIAVALALDLLPPSD